MAWKAKTPRALTIEQKALLDQLLANPVHAVCIACGQKGFWDNREGKRNPKAPDFKCRNKACDPEGNGPYAVWVPEDMKDAGAPIPSAAPSRRIASPSPEPAPSRMPTSQDPSAPLAGEQEVDEPGDDPREARRERQKAAYMELVGDFVAWMCTQNDALRTGGDEALPVSFEAANSMAATVVIGWRNDGLSV